MYDLCIYAPPKRREDANFIMVFILNQEYAKKRAPNPESQYLNFPLNVKKRLQMKDPLKQSKDIKYVSNPICLIGSVIRKNSMYFSSIDIPSAVFEYKANRLKVIVVYIPLRMVMVTNAEKAIVT